MADTGSSSKIRILRKNMKIFQIKATQKGKNTNMLRKISALYIICDLLQEDKYVQPLTLCCGQTSTAGKHVDKKLREDHSLKARCNASCPPPPLLLLAD